MKVLIFMTQLFKLGGAERLAVELAVSLNRAGIHTDILSMYHRNLPGTDSARQRLLDCGIPTVEFLGLDLSPKLWSLPAAIIRLNKVVASGGYDVLETSMMGPAILCSIGIWQKRASHVVGIHQTYQRSRDTSLRRRIFGYITAARKQTKYYAISRTVLESWREFASVERSRIALIYNSIPDSFFEVNNSCGDVRIDLDIPEDGKIALCVGRLAKYKSPDFLLASLGEVFETLNIYLLYVGSPRFVR